MHIPRFVPSSRTVHNTKLKRQKVHYYTTNTVICTYTMYVHTVCTVCTVSMYVCTACMYVCMHVQYVCTVCMYVCTVCMYVCTVCMYACTYVHCKYKHFSSVFSTHHRLTHAKQDRCHKSPSTHRW